MGKLKVADMSALIDAESESREDLIFRFKNFLSLSDSYVTGMRIFLPQLIFWLSDTHFIPLCSKFSCS